MAWGRVKRLPFIAIAVDLAGNYTQADAAVTVDYHPIYTWTGAVSHSWDEPGNWKLNNLPTLNVPGPGDIAVINLADLVESSIPRQVYGLRLSSGSLGNYTVTVTGGPGSSVWSGGTLSNQIIVAAGAFLTIDTTNYPYLANNGVINNAGTVIITGDPLINSGGYLAGYNSTFNNSGLLQIARDGTILYNQGVIPVINNTGTIVKTTGPGTGTLQWALNNNGAAGSDSGTIAFSHGSTALGSTGSFPSGTAGARVAFTGGSHTMKTGARFTGPGRGRISGATVTLEGAVEVGSVGAPAGGFEFEGGILNGAGSLSVVGGGGTVIWTAGTLSATLAVGAGARMDIDTIYYPYLANNGVINNAGTVTVTTTGNPLNDSGGYLRGYSGTFNNSGLLQIARDGEVLHNDGVIPVINNTGTIVKTAGPGTGTLQWALNNNGAAGSDSGTIAFSHGSTALGSTGSFPAGTAGARVAFTGGSHTMKTGARFTGPGRGRISGATMTLEGAVEVGSAGTPAGGFEIAGGTLNGPGSLSVVGGSGTVSWTTGTLSTTLTVGAGARLEIDTTAYPYLSTGTINNAGTGVITGDPLINSGGYLSGYNGTLNNSGLLQIARDGTVLYNQGVIPVINNTGTIVKTAGPGTGTLQWALNNNGAAGSDSGTLAFAAGSTALGSTGSFPAGTVAARVAFTGGTHTLKTGARFTGPGRGRISGATMTFEGAAEVGSAGAPAGGFEIAGGTLNGPGIVSVVGGGGTVAWTAGTLSTTLAVGAGTRLEIDTTAYPYLSSGAINNAGTAVISGPSATYLSGYNGTFNNSGLLQVARDGEVLHNEGVIPVINNTGTIVKTTGPGTATFGWALNNNGAAGSDSGTLAFAAGSTALGSTGSFPAGTAAARVAFTGGTHTLKTGARFTGPGRGRISGATMTFEGAAEVGSAGAPAGGFEIAGGTLNGPGIVSVVGGGGTVAWTAGTLSTTLSVGAGARLEIETTAYPYLANGAIHNAGTALITGPSASYLAGYNGTFNNSGLLQIARDGTVLYNQGVVPVINNTGTIQLGAQASTVTLGWKFNQSATGILNLKVGGTNPATPQFDQINCNQPVNLGGALHVTLINGFIPTLGDNFPVMTYGSHVGSFATFSSPGAYFSRNYNAGNLTLTALIAPSTLAEWKAAYFAPGSPESASDADPDGDGLSNFAEFVFNTNPLSPSPVPQDAGVETIDGQQWLTLGYRRWANPEADGVIYTPQVGGGLDDWGTLGIIDEVDQNAPVIPGSTACRCRVLIGGEAKFLRVKATKP